MWELVDGGEYNDTDNGRLGESLDGSENNDKDNVRLDESADDRNGKDNDTGNFNDNCEDKHKDNSEDNHKDNFEDNGIVTGHKELNTNNDKFVLQQHNNQPIHAIDLVLQEIGEQSTNKDADQIEGKKLTFSTEDLDDIKSDRELQQQQESCSNPEFRYKVLDTIFLFWNTTTMGWVYGQMGPALPDLQFLVGASLQEATWVFTGFAIGYLGGCLLAGLIQDRFNPRMMLFLYTLGTAITITVLPWLPVLGAMIAIRVINGICIGGQDTGLHSMLFAIWSKDGGPFVQMTHVLSALGGILAPLVTQPFVSTVSDEPTQHATENKTHSKYNSTMWNTTSNTTSNLTEVLNNSTNSSATNEGRSTNIHYAFLITGVLVLSAAIPFLVAYIQKRKVIKATRQYSNESVDKIKLPKNIKRLILCILCVNSFVATAYIDLFPSFLTTFVMEQVSWSQKSASTITSVYFATYAAGNFIGVFILAYITSTKLIVFSYVSSSIMITGILLSITFNHTELIWVTVGLAGLTMSGILPTLFTWTQEHVTPITARLASILLISGSAGVMVNPILLGYMMEQLSPMWFIYLSLGETVFCALLFATAFILSRVYSAQRTTKSHEISALNDGDKSENEISENKTEIYPRGTLYGI